MKVGKQYLGKYVEITWKDPGSTRVKADKARRGLAALATWHERGIIDDITEGVVRIAHADAAEPGEPLPDEFEYTWVPEELITNITIYEPVKEGAQ